MATTIPGGRYLNADGTWVDANGKPLAPEPQAEDEAKSEPTPEPQAEDEAPKTRKRKGAE